MKRATLSRKARGKRRIRCPKNEEGVSLGAWASRSRTRRKARFSRRSSSRPDIPPFTNTARRVAMLLVKTHRP